MKSYSRAGSGWGSPAWPTSGRLGCINVLSSVIVSLGEYPERETSPANIQYVARFLPSFDLRNSLICSCPLTEISDSLTLLNHFDRSDPDRPWTSGISLAVQISSLPKFLASVAIEITASVFRAEQFLQSKSFFSSPRPTFRTTGVDRRVTYIQ